MHWPPLALICKDELGRPPNLEDPVIDTLLNLLFRCAHRRLTRPLTKAGGKGVPPGKAYVVCLDCGKQFDYDVREMRMGKPLDQPYEFRTVRRFATMAAPWTIGSAS